MLYQDGIGILFSSVILFLAIVDLCFYFLLSGDIREIRFLVFVLAGFILQYGIVVSGMVKIRYMISVIAFLPPLSTFIMSCYVVFLLEYIGGEILKLLYIVLILLFPFLQFLSFISMPLGFGTKFYYPVVWHGITLVLISVYLLLIIYKLQNIRIEDRNNRLWLIIQIISLLLVCILLGYSLDLDSKQEHLGKDIYFIFTCINFITLASLYFHLFYLYKTKLKGEREKRINILQPLAGMGILKNTDKHFKSKNTDSYGQDKEEISPQVKEMEDLKKRINQFFEENAEVYLDFDFKLDTLSKYTNISKSRLSKTFTHGFYLSFHQYLNEKRIAYACRLLSENKDMTTTALADSCGYKSRASFYSHFKLITGKSVTQYRADIE